MGFDLAKPWQVWRPQQFVCQLVGSLAAAKRGVQPLRVAWEHQSLS